MRKRVWGLGHVRFEIWPPNVGPEGCTYRVHSRYVRIPGLPLRGPHGFNPTVERKPEDQSRL